MEKQYIVSAGAGVSGSVLSYLIGGWSELFGFFLFLMVVDYFTGIGASIYEAKTGKGDGLSSSTGYRGLLKKAGALVAIIIAHRLDVMMDTDIVMTGALWAYVVLELVSIVENYGRMDLYLPKPLTDVIAVLKNKHGDKQ